MIKNKKAFGGGGKRSSPKKYMYKAKNTFEIIGRIFLFFPVSLEQIGYTRLDSARAMVRALDGIMVA